MQGLYDQKNLVRNTVQLDAPSALIQFEIVGTNALLLRAKRLVEQAGSLRILFYGETGSGKTPFARYSNQIVSEREGRARAFEQVNCACLSPEHFQDQLFGHKRGAFTGALSDKAGLVEIARGGDLFLDEIGDMPLDTQAHFLTFLDSLEYYRLGDDKKRIANVRILCATNKDLRKQVELGLFRQDLYSRISQVVVPIPPLRDRKEDIADLFEHFVLQFAGYVKPYAPEILQLFERYSWKQGNVRELRDAVEYLCAMSDGLGRLEASHLCDRFRDEEGTNPTSSFEEALANTAVVYDIGLEGFLDMIERKVLESLLERNDGCMETLAKRLKTSRSTLYRRIKKHSGAEAFGVN